MDKEMFVSAIKVKIEKRIGKDFHVYVERVEKVNIGMQTAMVIAEKDCMLNPVIYMEGYYCEYVAGKELDAVVDEVLSEYDRKIKEPEKLENLREQWFLNLEGKGDVTDRIHFQIVGIENNRDYLSDKVYEACLDMALVAYILVGENREDIARAAVTENVLERIGITREECLRLARENTPRLFPHSFRPMQEILWELMEKEFLPEPDGEKNLEDAFCEEGEFMFVLSNQKGINGAAAMMYPGVLEMIAGKIGDGFYILPSSRHEIIIVRDIGGNSPLELRAMVREINGSVLVPEDVLTDSVYFYEEGELKLA